MSAVTDLAIALVLGGTMAAGILFLLAAVPRWRAASLAVRIGPYVRDVVPDERLPRGVVPVIGMLPASGHGMADRLVNAFGRLVGGTDSVRSRLGQAGSAIDTTRFRARQLGWGIAGLALGASTVVIIALIGRFTVPVVLLPVISSVAAVVLYDIVLSSRVKARRSRMTEELPTTLEFLALCLSAGEGFLDALRRVSSLGSGELTTEFRKVVLAVNTGSALADALSEMAARLELPGLTRATDQVIAALEHGAPLAGVLHAQANDAREDAKRVLIEQAGRKEILMLLPLVFLILPLSVLFAVYPGLFILRLGIG